MQRTDLATPFALGPSLTSRRSIGLVRLSALLFACCAILFPAPCHAQSQTQSTDQSVVEAARQERARKETQQKKSQHVYTEEDLHRAQILTPEDHAQIEARKNQQAPPEAAQKSEQAVDAQSLPPDAPLGDVARHFRQQKQLQKLQQTADFHLPFANAPGLASPNPIVLASPKPPVPPSSKPSEFASPKPRVFNLSKPLSQPQLPNISKPLAPRFAPYLRPLKRSPFERPRFFVAEPTIPSLARPAPDHKLTAPTRLAIDPEQVVPKLSPAEHTFVAPSVSVTTHKIVTPTRPLVAPPLPAKAPIAPRSSTQATVITVKLGDSLWKLAKQNLGSGLRWRELLSANPTIHDPNRIFAGSQIVLPPANSPSAANQISRPSHSPHLP